MAPIPRLFLRAREHIEPVVNGRPETANFVEPSINTGVFFALLGATFTIFIFTVICWKFGAIARVFSRHRVLGGGKTAAIPHAKTWCGWVPVVEHQRRKALRRKRFSRIRQKMAWRSCHADYSWVWWDPEGSKFYQHARDKDDIRWVPRCFRSYTFGGANAMWNPVPPKPDRQSPDTDAAALNEKSRQEQNVSEPVCSGGLVPGETVEKSGLGTAGTDHPAGLRFWLGALWKRLTSRQVGQRSESKHDAAVDVPEVERNKPRSGGTSSPVRLRKAKSLPLLPSAGELDSLSRYYASRKRCVSDAHQDNVMQSVSSLQARQVLQAVLPDKPRVNWRTWKYKALGARMHCRGVADTPVHLIGLAGRPGSPVSEALNSMVSSPSQSEWYGSVYKNIPRHHAMDCRPPGGQAGLGYHSMNILRFPPGLAQDTGDRLSLLHQGRNQIPSTATVPHTARVVDMRRSLSESLSRPLSDAESSAVPLTRQRRATSDSGSITLPIPRLTNPELRLFDDLDRRLEWLSSEMDPGRKPFNFSLVHNHWLNRATWKVYDPVSRIAIDRQRTLADSRFNNPLPGPKPRAKQKYPALTRLKADTPRIDSWRLAVNKARKNSGLRELLRAVELFEGSVDEPWDGAIDPATWILRRPPQGYEMSSKQKNAYYGGGSGWCERLPDWQNVRRGYRIRKAVYEGKANRRRLAQFAKSVGGGCKTVARRVTPAWTPGPRSETDLEKQQRQERSGYGSISRHRLREKGLQTSPAPMDGLRRRRVSFALPQSVDNPGDESQSFPDQFQKLTNTCRQADRALSESLSPLIPRNIFIFKLGHCCFGT